MTKAIIKVGYKEYVVDADDAVKFHQILAKAERYDRTYRNAEEGGPLYYVWEQDVEDDIHEFRILPDSLYRMAKLAGKPQKKS